MREFRSSHLVFWFSAGLNEKCVGQNRLVGDEGGGQDAAPVERKMYYCFTGGLHEMQRDLHGCCGGENECLRYMGGSRPEGMYWPHPPHARWFYTLNEIFMGDADERLKQGM